MHGKDASPTRYQKLILRQPFCFFPSLENFPKILYTGKDREKGALQAGRQPENGLPIP
jgi:hypothetical protein